jgi:radical SAM superfamily enzyme YgiQ (UPF0313 family)
MSEYNRLIFLGFSACIPKGLIPDWLYYSMFCPSVEVNQDGSVKYAPCGIRKIEAVFLDNGFKRDEVVVAHPDHLDKVVGPNTMIMGITENDPLGLGPATSTFTQVLGGDGYMKVKFEEILNNRAVKRYKPKIIVGGPGAWQLEDNSVRMELGLDCVVVGEGEKALDSIVKKAIKNKQLPELVYGEIVEKDEIPVIKEPTIDGIVEIARGCGRGCAFCVPTLQQYRCLSIDHILKEVEVNLQAGRRPLLHAEDVLRYKAKGLRVNKEAVVRLFRTARNYPGVDSIAISHFALSSVASAPEVIEELSRIMELSGKQGNWLSGQTGLETGSPRLMRAHMIGKCKPFNPEDWPQVVVDAFQILSDNFWVPVATLIIGLPGETDEDVDSTIELLGKLKRFKSLLVPLFFVSEGRLSRTTKSFIVENITRKQTELFLKSWLHNLDWAETFLHEYFFINSPMKSFALRRFFAYSISKSKDFIRLCEDEYDYDLPTMIRITRAGKVQWLPFPFQFIYDYLRIRHYGKRLLKGNILD